MCVKNMFVFFTTDAFVYLCIELRNFMNEVFINSFQE